MSFYDDAKFMFLAGGAAGKDGKAYNIKPRQKIIGEELITNGTFDTDSDWTKVGESTISGGKGNIISTAGVWSNLNQTNVFTVGKHYRVALDVTVNSNAANFAIKLQDGGTDANIGLVTTSGSYEFFYTAEGTTLTIARYSTDSAVDASVDNVSVKEVEGVAADFTFERGTNLTATRVGKDGYIEKGRENLALHSNTFNNAVWGTQGSGTTLTSGLAGYDGTSDAWQLTVSGESGNVNQSLTTTGVKTVSVYAKSVSGSGIRLYGNESGGSNHVSVFFALTGEGSVLGTPDNSITQTITKVGNDGWYRCSMTFDKTLTKFYFYVTTGGASNSTDGTLLIQDAQAEVGLVATDYIDSGSTTGKAGLLEDEPRFDYTGGECPALLIEPTRVNKLPHSEYFTNQTYWQLNSSGTRTNNSATSPEGVLNATSFESVGSEYNILRSAPLTLDTSTEYVFSFYAKNVDATNAHYRVYNTDSSVDVVASTSYVSQLSTTEWKRIEVSFTTDSTDTNYSVYFASGNLGGEILLWGAQVEEGSYATSYIPTYGASATRTYDDPNELTHGITMGTSCSVFFEGKHVAPDAGQISMFRLRIGTDTNNRLLIHGSAAGATTFPLVVQHKEGGTSVNATGGTININESFKVLARIDGTTMDVFVNGSLTDTKPITATDIYDKISLYRTPATDQSGHAVKQAILFDSALSTNDSEIITGTSYSTFGQMASELSYTEYE